MTSYYGNICIYRQYFLVEKHNMNNNKVSDKQQGPLEGLYPFERFASIRSYTSF
jgi:hypothetical protein